MQHGIPKPCECGSLNLKIIDDTGFFIACMECQTEGPVAKTERAAWAAWNEC